MREWWKTEKLYRLSDLANPRKGLLAIPVGKRTLQEYAKVGTRSHSSGERITLEVIRVGAVYYTSVERVDQFVRDLNS